MTRERQVRGRRAEDLAVAELRRRGYAVRERNFRCRVGELDVIADHGDVLVFVEVRSRASDAHGCAIESVTPAKLAQVARVAQAYLKARGVPPDRRCRFDVVGITGDRIDVVTDAYRLT